MVRQGIRGEGLASATSRSLFLFDFPLPPLDVFLTQYSGANCDFIYSCRQTPGEPNVLLPTETPNAAV